MKKSNPSKQKTHSMLYLEKENSKAAKNEELVALNGTEKLKLTLSYILTVVILLSMAIFIFFLYFVNADKTVRIVGTVAIALLTLVWLLFEYRGRLNSKSKPRIMNTDYETPISRFVLISRDGEREKEWYCNGYCSFLIGKGTAAREVDIELGDTHYCEFISNEHAVLNYSNGFWYIEDLNSANGVGIKKKDEEYALRLKPLVSYKIDEGDILYISKAKIQVR